MNENNRRVRAMINRIRRIEAASVLDLAEQFVRARYKGEHKDILLLVIAARRGSVA